MKPEFEQLESRICPVQVDRALALAMHEAASVASRRDSDYSATSTTIVWSVGLGGKSEPYPAYRAMAQNMSREAWAAYRALQRVDSILSQANIYLSRYGAATNQTYKNIMRAYYIESVRDASRALGMAEQQLRSAEAIGSEIQTFFE